MNACDLSPLLLNQAVNSLLTRRVQAMAADPVELFARAVGRAPIPYQERVLRGSESVLLACGRQSGKSTTCSVVALHRALFFPGSLVILVAGVWRQSQELYKKLRDTYEAVAYVCSVTDVSATRMEFANGSRVVCLPGNASGVRGFSAPDLIVCDEAAFANDALFAALMPMTLVSRGRTILLSSPAGRRGFFWTQWSEGGDAWRREQVRSADCPFIDHTELERHRQTMPAIIYASEYEAEFTDLSGSVFAYDHIMAMLDCDAEPLFEAVQ